ncbi:MAG: GspE/PulE family protein [Opitutales bacterium]
MTSADDFVIQLIEDKSLVSRDQIAAARQAVEEAGNADDPDAATLQQLIEAGHLDAQSVTQALAEEFGLELVDLNDIRISREALDLVPFETARRYGLFPLAVDEGELDVAISDPLDVDAIDSVGHLTGRTLTTRLTTPEAIQTAIHQYYEGAHAENDGDGALSELGQEAERAAETLELPTGDEEDVSEEDAPIIRYVHMLIAEAINRRTSDIHLEPLEKRFRVRYRIDGVLIEVENPPKRLQPAIISRLKLMANVSLAEKRLPQDGRISIKVKGKTLDLRVSTLPTAFGESIVMRILDKEGLKLGLPELGFFSDDQEMFERIITMPDGVFLVTGPTGSGKSTTLYSALNYINHPDRKIITVEDPVEYELAGINQVQVRKEVGMTFSSALRSMLRQAPNIIMVGEIRDKETAEIAINAALTGHMVFSTLHTNDAASAVSRLVDIGIKPFLVSAALRAVMAQRLVRQIDPNHSEPYSPGPGELQLLGIREDQVGEANFMRGIPHVDNAGTGFRGRKGVFELFRVNEEIQQMIYEDCTLVELRRKARELGMRTMREDGIRKVLAGITTIQEVLHVTSGDTD